MALVPEKVQINTGSGTASIRKAVLFFSIVLLALGAVFIFVLPLINQAKPFIPKEQLPLIVRGGLACLVVGLMGLIARSNIK
jgi:hypothetical protein